jgi:1-aminocyclopropane-1-carboxylate deaminase
MMTGLLLGSAKGTILAQEVPGHTEPATEGNGRHPGAAGPATGIIGIPVLRNTSSLEAEIRALLPRELKEAPIHLDHRFHGGGYAKTTNEQLAFMASFHAQTGIPTDIIYTSKLMRAVWTMIREGFFPPHSRILAIHSGGLQGNRSLKKGILPF